MVPFCVGVYVGGVIIGIDVLFLTVTPGVHSRAEVLRAFVSILIWPLGDLLRLIGVVAAGVASIMRGVRRW